MMAQLNRLSSIAFWAFILIIAILLAVSLFKKDSRIDNIALTAKEKRFAGPELKSLLQMHSMNKGIFPEKIDGAFIKSLFEKYYDKKDSERAIELFKLNRQLEMPKDSWGNSYHFISTSTEISIISSGPNGKYEDGKGDDIVSSLPLQTVETKQ